MRAKLSAKAFCLLLAAASGGPARAGPCPGRNGRIFPSGDGLVIGFLTGDQADALRLRMEARLSARLAPSLRDRPRAIVLFTGDMAAIQTIAFVPDGLEVGIGDRVMFDGARWDPDNACQYVPNLIRKPGEIG